MNNKTFKNEFIEDLPASEYHKLEYLSKSKLDHLRRSPEYFKFKMEQEEQESTKAMEFGTLLHTLLLVPEEFDKEFAVAPNVDRRTTAGKQVWAEFTETTQNKIIVKAEDISLASEMIQAIKEHPIAGELFDKGKREITMLWEKEGLQFKGRIDNLIDGGLIVDFKTTASALPEEFERRAYDYGYHRQAHLYMDGYEKITGKKAKAFVIVAVEKTAPYGVCVFMADDVFLAIGKDEVESMVQTYKHCADKNNWYGFNGEKPHFQMLSIPGYIQSKYYEGGADQ